MIKVFISYAHGDEHYKEKLSAHLSGLTRLGTIDLWNDRRILPGVEWDEEIKSKIEQSQIILFLVSDNFSNSNYINDIEIKKAIDRHQMGKIVIIPVVIKPFDLSSLPISKFQAVPKNAKPISKWKNKDEGFVDVVQQLKKVFELYKNNNQ